MKEIERIQAELKQKEIQVKSQFENLLSDKEESSEAH